MRSATSRSQILAQRTERSAQKNLLCAGWQGSPEGANAPLHQAQGVRGTEEEGQEGQLCGQ